MARHVDVAHPLQFFHFPGLLCGLGRARFVLGVGSPGVSIGTALHCWWRLPQIWSALTNETVLTHLLLLVFGGFGDLGCSQLLPGVHLKQALIATPAG